MSHPLHIAFIWHMHQPYYRDLVTGECSMPWVRLHAAKDYVDMVKRLEVFPGIHQTFNVVPSLLDQLQEYLSPANQTDAFLALSEKPAAQLTPMEQQFTLQWFFMANLEQMIKPYARYHDLLAKRGLHVPQEQWPAVCARFRPQDYLDLQVWFNLAWIDPWLRRQDAVLKALEAKGTNFTEEDKRAVLAAHRSLIGQVLGAYRQAAERGQVELTTSPYYHPIVPLLCDLRSAQAALPGLSLPPVTFQHPEDARWQLQHALERHEQAFGRPARGLWPPEGSVSEDTVAVALEAKVRWLATDEAILWQTLQRPRTPDLLYRPHRIRRQGGELAIVFRDRELSDRIGFVYSRWKPAAAVQDFLSRLADIQQQVGPDRPALVSIILDGENAWECYPDDGHEFLTQLYAALAADARFRCVTVGEFLDAFPPEPSESLPALFSGSWIDANFATWIGHPEKNTAWTLLARARDALVAAGSRDDPARANAWNSLGVAEGSDWMWWYGDTHFSAQAEEFDRLFRTHVANSYRLAGLPVPEELGRPIRRPAAALLFEPTSAIHPTIDGRETSYYEWLYAGRFDFRQYAAIHRSSQCLCSLGYGWDERQLYFRVDLDLEALASLKDWTIEISWSHAGRLVVRQMAGAVQARLATAETAALPCALDRVLELAVPKDRLALQEGERLELAVTLTAGGETLERYPSQGTLQVAASSAQLETQAWPL